MKRLLLCLLLLPLVSGGEVEECALSLGMEEGQVVYLYKENCPVCSQMPEPMASIDPNNTRFYHLDIRDSSEDALEECFAGLVGGYVPQFICPGNEKRRMGFILEHDLREFVEDCETFEEPNTTAGQSNETAPEDTNQTNQTNQTNETNETKKQDGNATGALKPKSEIVILVDKLLRIFSFLR